MEHLGSISTATYRAEPSGNERPGSAPILLVTDSPLMRGVLDHAARIAAADATTLSARTLRGYLGDFTNCESLPKMMSRIGQCFSQALASRYYVVIIIIIIACPDIDRHAQLSMVLRARQGRRRRRQVSVDDEQDDHDDDDRM